MATGKKGKKTKGKTLPLTTFLQQESTGPLPSVPVRKNWADEVEDSYDGSYESRNKSANVILPTAPKASRDYEDISEKVPKDPPYMAYISNLPYDIDDEEIAMFFKNMKISRMNIPKDERPGEMPKLKGFGYVEFEDRDSLINALVIPDTTIKSRRIRIEVAANSENDKRRGRMDMGRDRSDRGESTGDWRANPRSDNQDSDRRGYSRDNRDDGGFTRSTNRDRDDDKPGGWREGERTNRDTERNFSRNRDDRGSHFDSERGSRFSDRDGDRRGGGGFDRDSERRPFNRGYGDRDGDRRGGYGSRKFDDEDRNGGMSRNRDEDSSRLEPRQRQKLMLAPRSKPVENTSSSTTTTAATPVPSASIFGNAKPVDTAMKERQIYERLAKEQEKSRESSRDRRNAPHSDDIERRPIERSQISRRDDSPPSSDRPSSQNRNDDDQRPAAKNDTNKPPEEKKSEKPRREDKKDKLDKEMPKLKEPEAPNFAQNNKFAFLQEDDISD